MFWLQRGRAHTSAERYLDTATTTAFTLLQRGRAHTSAESALLLLPLAQVRNTSLATAYAVSSVCLLAMSNCLVTISLF